LSFKPGHSLFANNDSLEEGVRQFLNNYIFYICEKLKGDLKFIVRGRTLGTIGSYIEMINTAISLGQIGLKKDLWNLSFSTEMAKMTNFLGSTFQHKLSDKTSQEQMEQIFNKKLPDQIKNHSRAMQAMGITR